MRIAAIAIETLAASACFVLEVPLAASAGIVLEVPLVAMSIVGEACCMACCMSVVAVGQGTLLAITIAVDMAVATFHNLVDQTLLEGASVLASSYLAAVAGCRDYSHLAIRSGESIDSWSR